MERKKETKIELPVEEIKNEILGKQFELSFAFISKKESQYLNKTYRGKDESTDILSFPLEKNCGEILICKDIAKLKAPQFDKTLPEYLLFLVIHGCLHLKGLRHGSKMSKYELQHYSRHRRRHL
jgi:probable rRNA maturation factor